MRFFKVWKARLTDRNEFANYWASEGHKVILIVLYVIVSIILFIEAAVRWAQALEPIEKAQGKKYSWVIVARGFGQLLNFNCVLILIPVLRSFITYLRKTRLANYLPLDKNIVFHRYIAYFIVFAGVAHGSAHYYNYNCCSEVYFDPVDYKKKDYDAAWTTLSGTTGNLLYIVMLVMFSASHGNYRKSRNFTVFWFVHHLFIIFFGLLLMHGKNYWKWFIGPAFLYLVERILRLIRGAKTLPVAFAKHLPSQVLYLGFDHKKSGFTYLPGQYCFLNCPALSNYEWHPFTISSAPEEENLSFHIRCVGDWTQALSTLAKGPQDKKDDGKGSQAAGQPASPQPTGAPVPSPAANLVVRVDGPFGAPAEHIFDFDHIMLIAAGIGVTPYASILKHVQHRLQNNNVGSLKKVYFYWVNRDEGSWEWFSDILTDLEGKVRKDFLEVHTYFTGALKADDIRNIVFSSSEVAKHAAATPVAAYARAMYAYAAQASDEMDLQEDDDVEVEVRNADGWWLGTNKKSGKKGLFPANYVQVIDKITKMEEGSHRHFGRPYWEDIFADVAKQVELVTPQRDEKRPKIGVFFCGPAVMSKQLYGFVGKANKKGRAFFDYKKENF